MADRSNEIREKLNDIERERGVKVLYACESGSRAWGVESVDSDWDVRFIYMRPADDYLSLWPFRDVIETVDGDLDFAGWDLAKALRLAASSNPAVIEWLQCPIYRDVGFGDQLRSIMERFSPRRLIHHYASLASRQHKAYLGGRGPVRLKKYLYAVRPLMAVDYMAATGWAAPPVALEPLSRLVWSDPRAREAVASLLALKRAGTEADAVGRYPVLDDVIRLGIPAAHTLAETAPDSTPSKSALQALFLRTVKTGI